MAEFFEEEGRLLTPNAFEFVLDGEMKRAVRSQNYLTLVVLETRREWDGMTMTADDGTVDEVAKIVGHEVRDTDLIGNTEIGVGGGRPRHPGRRAQGGHPPRPAHR